MQKFYLLLVLSIISAVLMLSSCEYQPTGSNFIDIDSNYTAAYFEISLNTTNNELILLDNYRNVINYELTGDLVKFSEVVFFLNEKEIARRKNSKSTFEIKTEKGVVPRFEKLNIVVLARSATGSLADLLGLEGSYIYGEWSVKFIDNAYLANEAIQVVYSNGAPVVSWKEYPFDNFKSYLIYRKSPNSSDKLIGTIGDKSITSFKDSTYLGGGATYAVKISFNSFHNDLITYRRFDFPILENELPKFTFEFQKDNRLKITWTKSKLHENILRFTVYENDLFKESNFQFLNNDELTHYVTVESLGFDDSINVRIHNKGTNEYVTSKERYSVRIGEDFPKHNNMVVMGDFAFLNGYIAGTPKLIQYSLKDNEIVSEQYRTDINNALLKSPNDKYLCQVEKYRVEIFPDGNFNNKINISASEFKANLEHSYIIHSISDNGLLSAIYKDTLIIYDFINKKQIFKEYYKYLKYAKISPNGKYFVVAYTDYSNIGTVIFKKSDNGYISIQSEPYYSSAEFSKNNDDLLYLNDDNYKKIYEYNCIGLNKRIVFSNESGSYLKDGYLFNMLHGSYLDSYTIYDINNSFNKISSFITSINYFYVSGKSIYFRSGLKCTL